MKTIRELAKQQLDLMEEIRYLANINMVTCGNCGTILLHDMKPFNEDNKITCFGCKSEMELSDCPDYWYEGCIENSEFDEPKTISSYIDADDVIRIAMSLGMNPDIDVIEQVLRGYDSEANNDPTATWELIVENLLYNKIIK